MLPLVVTKQSNHCWRNQKEDEHAPLAPQSIGAPHASEIEYCMGNLYLVDDFGWTDDDYKVSQMMLSYFANFIKTGNPNAEGLPEWTAAGSDSNNPPIMLIDVESKTAQA